MKILVVGSGLTGSVIAREMAEQGHLITVIDQRSHIAGNCFTKRDESTQVMEHVYGPHIFHTSDKLIWKYINEHGEFKPYIHRVKTTYDNQVYSLPINLHTINQFYKKNFNPSEAKLWIDSIADQTIKEPENFEQQALKFIGADLYDSFFKGYTKKQWGCNPCDLPASVLKRLPVRFNYNDNYFNDEYQGIPINGYTPIIESILKHKSITILLNTPFNVKLLDKIDHVIWTGKIDEWFNYSLGKLRYRTLDFEKQYASGDYQGLAVMNYGNEDIPYTRISEHKFFSPWEHHNNTIYFKEYSRNCDINDIPYYPVNLVNDKQLLEKYMKLVINENNVTFAGRLGTYRYLDMDATIKEALNLSEKILIDINKNHRLSPFYH